MLCCHCLKCRIIHFCTSVCFVGDRTDHKKWNIVKVCCLSYCCTLHFDGICTEFFYDEIFYTLVCNKLVAGCDTSLKYFDVRIDFFTCLHCQLAECIITVERKCIHLRNLTYRITKCYCIHIMMDKVCGNYDIADVDICIQTSCDTCIDHDFCMEIVNQDLCTNCCIYFTDSRADNNYFFAF